MYTSRSWKTNAKQTEKQNQKKQKKTKNKQVGRINTETNKNRK